MSRHRRPAKQTPPNPVKVWDDIASFWDESITPGGNKYFHRLQAPCLDRLLGKHLHHGARCLDLATGNGLVARWLLDKGVGWVLATDASTQMMEIAERNFSAGGYDDSQYLCLQTDVTVLYDMSDLQEYGGKRQLFDIIVINMALMDIERLDVLAEALPRLLNSNGVFVATVLHPVFFTCNPSKSISISFDPATGEQVIKRSKVITEYLDVAPAQGIACPNQPVKQTYYHRPIHELLSIFLKDGDMVLDAIEEPAFNKGDFDDKRVESSTNFTQLPALFAFRLRRRVP
ncbi:S-adenosyl-L-methionine-dependent methyltransferase [Triangularia verruculosa]|uniref:S-adenosyl-L-methionine-dependent methyltransferase n=1 Tax=Triangularia verruculosa TaxID=2587418 RepID=A0AAN7AWV2_9PEZI|nr:S-adenosyl-L-methionine-dependent methyltransferase [Triangularia verruculosa]